MSVVVLTNAGGGAPERLLKQLTRAALGVPLAVPPPVVALAPAFDPDLRIVFTMAGGRAEEFTLRHGGRDVHARRKGQRRMSAVRPS
ncbi:MAG: hypothetical protein ACK53A_16460 [Gemmatimonadota bacterium]|nr:hypothetical protein [Gemmatimonadota bacterium]